jgi:acetylornithine/N-succinyldiaminopimelate aminotransferase
MSENQQNPHTPQISENTTQSIATEQPPVQPVIPQDPYKAAIMPTYGRFDVTFVKGKGATLWDDKGEAYLDFVSGVAVNALGHAHPEIVDTICHQAANLMHISNLYWNAPQLKLAKSLADLSNGDLNQVFFCNSGTEALEGALKLARKYGQKRGAAKIAHLSNSFHGRTMGALSVTGQEKYQAPFRPLIPEVYEFPANDVAALASLDSTFCAILVEPIQGEGGVNTIQESYLLALKTICEQHDILLIFDEVQTGIGRLGTFYAYQSFNVVPDVVCLAKGLGCGFPIGAIVASTKASVLAGGDHGSTFGGNPLATAVACKAVEIISNPEFLIGIQEKSKKLTQKLKGLADGHLILNVKGMGLLIGLDLGITSKKFNEKAFANKLLLIPAGENVIRVLPPLNVSDEEIDLLIEKLTSILTALKEEKEEV